jgi:hypothetical protein
MAVKIPLDAARFEGGKQEKGTVSNWEILRMCSSVCCLSTFCPSSGPQREHSLVMILLMTSLHVSGLKVAENNIRTWLYRLSVC